MTALPPSVLPPRSPRVSFTHTMPAVLRFSNGQSGHAEIRVLSLTGGLLTMPRCIHHGARVKIMFLLETGAVLSGVEMLRPVNWTQQPFRFLDLEPRDMHRLQSLIETELGSAKPVRVSATVPPRSQSPKSVNPTPPVAPSSVGITPVASVAAAAEPATLDDAWITHYRANLDRRNAPRKRPFAAILGAIGLSVLCLCSAAYVYSNFWK